MSNKFTASLHLTAYCPNGGIVHVVAVGDGYKCSISRTKDSNGFLCLATSDAEAFAWFSDVVCKEYKFSDLLCD